jgi:hypothetical protein
MEFKLLPATLSVVPRMRLGSSAHDYRSELTRPFYDLLILFCKLAFRASNKTSTPAACVRSLKLRVLRFGFMEDGDVGVAVFPESEEIVVGRFRLGTFACHRALSRRCHCPRLPTRLLSKVLDHPDVAIGCPARHRQMPPVGRRYSFGAHEIEFLMP